MLKNITACALTAMCILAVSASAGAQGVVDGVVGAAEDIAGGVGEAGRELADGIMGTDAGDPGTSSDPDTSSSDSTSSDDSDSKDASDPVDSADSNDSTDSGDISDSTDSTDSTDSDSSDNVSDSLNGAAGSDNPDTGISFGYVAGMAVLGALGVAITLNKRRG